MRRAAGFLQPKRFSTPVRFTLPHSRVFTRGREAIKPATTTRRQPGTQLPTPNPPSFPASPRGSAPTAELWGPGGAAKERIETANSIALSSSQGEGGKKSKSNQIRVLGGSFPTECSQSRAKLLASRYNGQKGRTSAAQARACCLQRQLYARGKRRMAHFAGGFIWGVPPPPKRRHQYSRWQIPFHLDTRVLSSAGARLSPGRGLKARRPSGKRVRLQAAGKGETRFEEVRALTSPRCRCKTQKRFPFFRLSEIGTRQHSDDPERYGGGSRGVSQRSCALVASSHYPTESPRRYLDLERQKERFKPFGSSALLFCSGKASGFERAGGL